MFELVDLFFLRCRQLFLTSSYFEPCKGLQALSLFALSEGSSALQGQSEKPAADKRKEIVMIKKCKSHQCDVSLFFSDPSHLYGPADDLHGIPAFSL